MRRIVGTAAIVAALSLIAQPAGAQAQDESSKAVAGGGITAPDWQGKVDPNEAAAGLKITDAKLATMGSGLQVTTGPATTYWNTKQKLTGDYTVMATFNEAKFMAINPHAHPYGIVIAAKGFDTDKPEALYCAAYGDGRFIFRGFSATAPRGVFQLNGRMGETHAAVNKAAGKDQPVKQDISVSVKGDNVTCSINGQVVATQPKSALIGDGKLTSLDGYAGVRFGHNTDAHVSGWMVMK
jgi:hypothetical protein